MFSVKKRIDKGIAREWEKAGPSTTIRVIQTTTSRKAQQRFTEHAAKQGFHLHSVNPIAGSQGVTYLMQMVFIADNATNQQ